MAYRGVPPETLQMWADEVRYLHSLYRHSSSQNPNPNPSPSPNSLPINPTNRTTGKKRTRREQPQPSDHPPVDIEWPTLPAGPSPTPPGQWPEFVRNPNSRHPPSAEDQAKVAASTAQQNAITASRHLFSNSDSEDEDEDDDDDDETDDDEEEREEEAVKFFLGLFEVDGELRRYYEKNCDDGEFSCLVCGGLGVKIGRKYRGCVGLVQHASSISEKRGTHRGFRRVVCRVLGWDVSRLPNIVLDLGETLGQSLTKAAGPHNDLQKENDIDQTTEKPNHDLQKNGANGELTCMEAKELVELTTSPNPEFPVISIVFEKGNKKKEQEKLNRQFQLPDSPLVENDWPVSSNYVSLEPTGCPKFPPNPATTPLSMEDQAKVAALRLQQNGLRASQDFLKKDDSSDYDGDGKEHENDNEERAFKFFLGLFERDKGLRIYYEKNYGNGEFCCLVCGGTGVKMGKKYRDCIGIVQHSKSISNTKWKGAHRGFGRAVCQVLGWGISRLPSIVHDLGESFGQSLEKAANPQIYFQKENEIEEITEVPNKDVANGEVMDRMEAREPFELPRNYNPNPKLDPGTSSTLTKESKKRKKEQKKSKKEAQQPDPGVVENKWPTGWPEFPPKPSRSPLSVEEQAKVTASRVQQNGLRAACDFLKKNDSSDADDEKDENETEEEAFEFFLGLFERDEDLRIYYEKNYENGDFCCLVCGGIGVKLGKKFRECVGMVQHSNSIAKTKRRGAHRGFGRAVCRVLGWDISRLPNIVLDLGESLGRSLAKVAQNQKDGTFGDMMAGEEPKESIELPSGHMEGIREEKEKLLEHAEALDYMETREIISLSSDDD